MASRLKGVWARVTVTDSVATTDHAEVALGRERHPRSPGCSASSGADGASTPGRDRQARRRDRTGAVRVVPPAAAVGASPDAVRQALAAARLRGRPALGGRGEGVRSGERVGEGATAGRPGAGRGEWAPGPAQPAPIPPSTPRSPAAARQGARLSASEPRGRREATGSKRSSPGRIGAEAGVVAGNAAACATLPFRTTRSSSGEPARHRDRLSARGRSPRCSNGWLKGPVTR